MGWAVGVPAVAGEAGEAEAAPPRAELRVTLGAAVGGPLADAADAAEPIALATPASSGALDRRGFLARGGGDGGAALPARRVTRRGRESAARPREDPPAPPRPAAALAAVRAAVAVFSGQTLASIAAAKAALLAGDSASSFEAKVRPRSASRESLLNTVSTRPVRRCLREARSTNPVPLPPRSEALSRIVMPAGRSPPAVSIVKRGAAQTARRAMVSGRPNLERARSRQAAMKTSRQRSATVADATTHRRRTVGRIYPKWYRACSIRIKRAAGKVDGASAVPHFDAVPPRTRTMCGATRRGC